MDGCTAMWHQLGPNFVTGVEDLPCRRDIGARAQYTVGTSSYTGTIAWDDNSARKVYPSDYHTFAVKVYHGTR